MKKAIKITIVVVPIILLAFIGYMIVSRGERLAKKFVASGNIVKTLGVIKKEKLSKQLLLDTWHEKIWMVQDKSPDTYLGKEIIHYGFIVKGHPWDESDLVLVAVMVSENKVIGGYSYLPGAVVNSSSGGIFSIQGLPMVAFTGISVTEWVDQWEKKYIGNGFSTGDLKTAEDYVKNQGYKITASRGLVRRYTLEKKLFFEPIIAAFYGQEWGVQRVEPDQYFGKEITLYDFTVKDHPLQKKDPNAKNGVKVYIMMSEGKVVGGYSIPDAEVVGGCYSLDGKTLEEVTGLSYTQWSNDWKKKYGE